MSHYAVNASVPKTLIRHLVGWMARNGQLDWNVRETLEDILRSQMTPELIPASEGKTVSAEDTVGPYELQDFNLYYLSRFGFRPSKVAFLAFHAWSRRGQGTWPSSIPEVERREYDLVVIKRWLGVFIQRFFQSSQFKRSALPNGPKVGSGGSLSPRGDWRAPSDATADAWLKELRSGVRSGQPSLPHRQLSQASGRHRRSARKCRGPSSRRCKAGGRASTSRRQCR